MTTTNYLPIFIKQLDDFLNEIQHIFPDNIDIQQSKNAILLIKQNNPKLIATVWKSYIYTPYKQVIDDGDVNFFLNNNFANDEKIASHKHSAKIIETINKLKNPISLMSSENQKKSIKYIQTLSKLSLHI